MMSLSRLDQKIRAKGLKFSGLLVAILYVILFVASPQVFAISSEQRRLFDGGIYYYDVDRCESVGTEPAQREVVGSNLDSAEQVGAFTGPRIEPSAIILHWTAGEYDSPQQLVETLRSRTGPGYPNGRAVQLTIDKEGRVYQLSEALETRPMQTMDDQTWNDVSIGIEIESGSFGNDIPAHENDLLNNATQYQSVINVVKELMTRYNIPNEADTAAKRGVFGHYDAQPSNSDPGPNFMARVRQDVGQESGAETSANDTSSSSNGSCTCSSGQASFSGSNNEEIAFTYFQEKGLTPEQSAGIVGNLIHESGVMPNRRQGAGLQTISSIDEVVPDVGFGIAQWTTAGRQQAWRQFATDRNMDPLSLELQLEFLLNELETEPRYGYEHLKAAQDVRQAAWIFLTFFERPGAVINAGYVAQVDQPPPGNSASSALDTRSESAQAVLGQFGGSTVGVGGSCGGLSGDVSEPDYAANPNVQVDGSPPGRHTASNCTGTFTVGAASLQQFVTERWSPPVTSVGGYACRSIRGGAATSIHGLGRALDIMVDSTTPEGLATGDEIRNFMINNAEQLGVQRVIWNRYTWVADRDGWNPYTGESPHTDHVHVEINIAASNNATLGR